MRLITDKIFLNLRSTILNKIEEGYISPSLITTEHHKDFILALILLEEEYPLGYQSLRASFDKEEINSMLLETWHTSTKIKTSIIELIFNKILLYLQDETKKLDKIENYLLLKTPLHEEVDYLDLSCPFISFRLDLKFTLKGQDEGPFSELKLLDRLSMYSTFIDPNPESIPKFFNDYTTNFSSSKEKERRDYSKKKLTHRLRELKRSTLH